LTGNLNATGAQLAAVGMPRAGELGVFIAEIARRTAEAKLGSVIALMTGHTYSKEVRIAGRDAGNPRETHE
jgi:hypothetical protein